MSGAEHTGKLVLTVRHTGETRAVLPPEQAPVFRDDGAYIVTGGLGGLGLFLADRDGQGGLRPHRADRALQPNSQGAAGH